MTPGTVAALAAVPVFGALMCAAPAVTRPTLQFGVRVPPAHAGAAVIRRERHAYYWRSAAVAVCCAAVAIIWWRSGSRWLPRVILLGEIAADAGCIWLARRKIIAVKTTEGWFAGLRQTVVADTSWRARPQPFPIRWLIPAVAVITATVVIGIIRYPHLPAHLQDGLGGRRLGRTPVSAFTLVIAQLYVTGMWTALLVLIYRSRPDIDPADPAVSLARYRRFLGRFSRAALTMLALVDLTFLLAALQLWQLYRLPGVSAVLLPGPAAAGVLILIAVALQAGRDRLRPASGGQRPSEAAAGRDDDRFWKAGLIYINRADPAVVVPVRFGVGWTFNLGNRATWLIIAALVATIAGLAALRGAAGL
jgi:uncharacterized membrane protein